MRPGRARRSAAGRVGVGLAAAVAARAALAAVRAHPEAPALDRVNFRGRTVTLGAGPALTVAASITAALGSECAPTAAAALVAGLGSGAVGLYDDVVGARPEQRSAKGFAGHLAALREGRVTSGVVKVGGVGAAALAAAALLPRGPGRRAGKVIDVLLGAGVIAGTANLVNLLDLRPGRALKAGLALGAPLAASRRGGLVAGPVGAAAGLLPADLGEEAMLGDCGANALGALIGLGLAAASGRLARASLLAGVVGLTAASERVSFTKVIERTPVLREIDALGRSSGRPSGGTVRAPAGPRDEGSRSSGRPSGGTVRAPAGPRDEGSRSGLRQPRWPGRSR
jgi:UDP-N-acetylmuramyl pentapeptide phosphotransferase/UDP-N-acetylglucosamine-1-phosphate transferase